MVKLECRKINLFFILHLFGGLKLIFGGFWQCFNIKHYCYLTVLQYFKALILQLIILLIGALRRKLKL